MKKHALWLALLFCLGLTQTNAQTTSQVEDIEVSVTYAEYLGKTPPIRNLVPMANTGEEKLSRKKENMEAPENFMGRGKYKSSKTDALPIGPDPLRQTTQDPSRQFEVLPLVNIQGIDNNTFPNDPSGDIGQDHYLQAVNATTLVVWDKEGNMVGSPFAANTIWNQLGFSSAGDPIVLYDQEVNRWIITEFPSGNQLLFAISEDSDPFGPWEAWNFGTPSFPDYPKYGIWSNAYSVTTNEGGPSQLPCYMIDRQAILNGDASVSIQRIVVPGISSGPGFQVATPVDWSGTTPPDEDMPLIVSLRDDAWSGSDDIIRVHKFDIDWANSSNTTVTTESIVTSPFDTNPCSTGGGGFACIPQMGGGGLDGLPEVIMNQVHYRNFGSHESMVMNFITDVDGNNLSGIRWVELRRTGGNWELYQEGTWAPDDGYDRFMGGICMDGSGNIGLAYSVSSESIFAGLAFTGRRAGDPLGEMTVDEFWPIEGSNSINTFTRFGDYAHMSVDPTNDRTFWYTGEYAGSGNVDVRIFAFEISRDTTDIGPSALVTPASADDLTATETVTVEVTNYGLETQNMFQVGYVVDNGTPVIEDVNVTLDPEETYEHTFGPTADLSTVGDYEFTLFTNLMDDEAVGNDTLRVTVTKLPRWDASVSNITGLEGTLCGDPLPAEVVLTNLGTETLTSATITILLNGGPLEVINWTGSLASGASESVSFDVTGFIDGDNDVTATSSLPNGEVDEVPVNDSFTRDFNALADGVAIFLNILTDNYPGETTWELTTLGGQQLYTGGPYPATNTLFVEEFCLDPEECYTFTIFDSYGDGICCSFGEGNYNITDADGNVLFASTGEFAFSETNDFCAEFECMLDATADISPVSEAGANDGAIMVMPQNGTAPYLYSLNGGTPQGSNTFNGLAPGDYTISILDAADCTAEIMVSVPECALTIMVDVVDESGAGANDGSISIDVSGATGATLYSINGGVDFQTSPDFGGLGAGDYNIVVIDGLGCFRDAQVSVGTNTSASQVQFGYTLDVFPNPTEGVFRVEVNGYQTQGPWLPIEIYTIDGKLIQSTRLVKYDETFTGLVSLEAYPNGVYLVRFATEDINQMIRVVKQ
jgi:hypothetical protein